MNKKKILIVDDEEDLLSVLELRLTKNGYFVIKANNGNEAIRLAKEKHPDLILLDIWMPGLGGGEVAELLKDTPETKDIPVIFLTCLYTKGDEESLGHTIKGNFFISKPFEENELLAEIKNRVDSE